MRDPARIDRIVELLRKAWHDSPDLRLSQLVINLASWSEHRKFDLSDVYNVEDSIIEARLELLADGSWDALKGSR